MIASIRRWFAGTLAVVLAGTIAYLCFWPVPAEPVSWQAPVPPGFTGPYAPNTRLADLRTIAIGKEIGPEHIAIGPDGKLYAAMENGDILRMDPDGGEAGGLRQHRRAGSRLRLRRRRSDDRRRPDEGPARHRADGRVTVLADRVSAGDPVRYANSIVVAPDGTIYFTDASTRFAPKEWGGTYPASVLDILEQSASGRVLAYDPATKTTRIVARGFSFANGIALSADGRTLFVTETGRYRIWKIDGRARDIDVQAGSPQASVLIDNLPGLSRQPDARPRRSHLGRPLPAAQSGGGRPVRQAVRAQGPAADCRASCCRWADRTGTSSPSTRTASVVEDLQDPSGAYPETTGATETADRLYIHSLHAHAIGWMPR